MPWMNVKCKPAGRARLKVDTVRRLVSVDNLLSPERLLGLLAAIVSVDSLLHSLLWTARG